MWPDGDWERYPLVPQATWGPRGFRGLAEWHREHIFGISCLGLTSNSLLSGCVTLKSPITRSFPSFQTETLSLLNTDSQPLAPLSTHTYCFCGSDFSRGLL